jgi:hypothetical protein
VLTISSAQTPIYRWLSLPLAAAGVALAAFTQPSNPAVWLILVVIAASAVYSLNFAEVLDGGSFLVVKRFRSESRVELAGIRMVELADLVYPQVVTLHVEGEAGLEKVRFLPKVAGWSHPHGRGTAEDLMARVREARGKSAI